MKLSLVNARSVRNKDKPLSINEYVTDHDLDFLAITETWLRRNGDKAIITELTPNGYNFVNLPRAVGRGGGIGLLYRDKCNHKFLPKTNNRTFELLRTKITTTSKYNFNIYILYHPPPSSKASHTAAEFYQELETLFTEVSVATVPTVLVGDFNTHMDSFSSRPCPGMTF